MLIGVEEDRSEDPTVSFALRIKDILGLNTVRPARIVEYTLDKTILIGVGEILSLLRRLAQIIELARR
jgi:hypothetical protein